MFAKNYSCLPVSWSLAVEISDCPNWSDMGGREHLGWIVNGEKKRNKVCLNLQQHVFSVRISKNKDGIMELSWDCSNV